MGLSAVVYKTVRSFAKEIGTELQLDEDTGEVYPKEPADSGKYPASRFIEYKARLGSIAEIGYLRDLIEAQLGRDSVLFTRVLFSGSHAGDSIGIEWIPVLRLELQKLRSLNDTFPHRGIQDFIQTMSNLSDAAELQQNPIVFT